MRPDYDSDEENSGEERPEASLLRSHLAERKPISAWLYPLEGLATYAYLFENLMAWLYWAAISTVVDQVYAELDREKSDEDVFLLYALPALLITFVVLNNISEMTSLNPVEDAEYIHNAIGSSPYETHSPAISKLSKGLYGLTSFFALGSLLNLSLGTSLAIAEVVDDGPTRYGLSAMVLPAFAYYAFLASQSRKKVLQEIIATFKEKKIGGTLSQEWYSYIWTLLKSPEFLLRLASRVLYNCSLSGFVSYQVATRFFNLSATHPAFLYWAVGAMGMTLMDTLFTHTLSFHKEFFNDEFNTLDGDDLVKARVPRLQLMGDSLHAILRGVAVGWLTFNHDNVENFPLNIILINAVSFLAFSHHILVSYNLRRQEVALKLKKETMLEGSRMSVAEEPKEIFEEIAAMYKDKVEIPIGIINFCARIGKGVAFYGYLLVAQEVLTTNNIISTPLSLLDTAALAIILGVPSLIAEGKIYQKRMREGWAYYITKSKIGVPDRLEYYPPGIKHVATFFLPKDKYDLVSVRNARDAIQANPEEQEANGVHENGRLAAAHVAANVV